MVEIKEATLVKVFNIEGIDCAFRKVSKKKADQHAEKAVRALYRSTICWFLPVYDKNEVNNEQ